MPKREQVKKTAPPAKVEEEQVEPAKADTAVLEFTDELLDEIDGLLETNAEEFVKNYVQKGGE